MCQLTVCVARIIVDTVVKLAFNSIGQISWKASGMISKVTVLTKWYCIIDSVVNVTGLVHLMIHSGCTPCWSSTHNSKRLEWVSWLGGFPGTPCTGGG